MSNAPAPRQLRERWEQTPQPEAPEQDARQPIERQPQRSTIHGAPRQLQERWAQQEALAPAERNEPKQPGYWENPLNVAMHFNGLQADTIGIDWSKFGVDASFVQAAYDHFQQANQGKDWWEWSALSADDPYLQTLKAMAAPPEEAQYGSPGFTWQDVFGDVTPEGLTQQPTTLQPTQGMGMAPSVPELNPAQLAELPYWQQMAYRATTSPLLQGASQMFPTAIFGALTGLALGGPVGAIAGAAAPLLLGAGLGGLVDPRAGDYLKEHGAAGEWVDMAQKAGGKALELMGLPGQWMEQGLGTAAMLAEPNVDYLADVLAANNSGNALGKTQAAIERDAEMKRLLDNMGDVWETSKLTYESIAATWGGTLQQNIPAGIEAAIDAIIPGLEDDARLAGIGYVHRLGVAEPVKIDKVGLVALNSALTEVLNGEPPEEVLQKYQDYFGIGGQMTDLFNQSFADPLNVVPFAESGTLAKVSKWAGNPTLEAASKLAFSRGEGVIGAFREYGTALRSGTGVKLAAGGAKVPLLPTEYSKFQRVVSGVTKSGTIAELTPGVKAGRGVLSFVDNPIKPLAWLNALNDLTPESKVSAVQQQAFENAMLLSNLAGGDIDKMENMFRAWASMPPQKAAEVARILGMPEAVTVRQFMADFVGGKGGLNDMSAAWKLGGNKRKALANISTMLDESVPSLVKQIEKGDITAETLRERILARKPELANDPKFTAAEMKQLTTFFKDNWWAAHPEFYAAQMRNVLMDKVTANGIKAFGVKPGSSLERYSMAMRSLQNIMLLNMNPAYLVNNVANNIVMRAYEGVFGMKRPKTIEADFKELLGSTPYRLKEGAGPANIDMGMKDLDAEIEKARSAVRSATRGTDLAQKMQDFAQSVNRKMSGVQGASQAAERFESMQAMHAGVFRSLPYIKKLLVPAMEPGLVDALQAVGVDPAHLTQAFMTAKNPAELNKLINGEGPQNAGMYVGSAAQALGMEAARVQEMLDGSGVMAELNRRLELGQSIDDAMDGLDNTLRDWLSKKQQEDLVSRAEDVANRVQGEGLAASFDVLFGIFDRIETEWTRHMADLDAMYEIANKPGVSKQTRQRLISEAMHAERNRFDELGEWVKGTYAGVLNGMHFDKDLRTTFALRLDDYYKNWQSFFETRDQLWKDFGREMIGRGLYPENPEYKAAKNAVQVELGKLYDSHGEIERTTTTGLGELFTDMVGRQLGDHLKPTAERYFNAQNAAQDLRRQVMADFRAWERGDIAAIQSERVKALVEGWNPDRAHTLWPQFHERVYVPVVGEYIQSGFDGLSRLYKEISGEDVAPPRETAAPERYAAGLEEARTEQAQTTRAATPAEMTAAMRRASFDISTEVSRWGAIKRAFPNLSPEQADAYSALLARRAQTWSKQNGRPAREYYERFADIRKGTVEDAEAMLRQAGTLPQAANDPNILAQVADGSLPRGAVQFFDDGRAIITGFQSADVSTLAHELGHVFRRDLNAVDMDIAAEWSGAAKDEGGWIWTREAEEKFADGFVRYLEEGHAPTVGLRKVFERFKEWLTDLYQTIGKRPDVTLNTEMRGLFERLLSERVDEITNEFNGGPRHLGQMDEKSLAQTGWKGGRKHLFNAVNGERRTAGLESYKKFEDVPWQEAQHALKKRNVANLTGYDKFLYSKVTDLPEWLRDAVKGAASQVRDVLGHGEAGRRIFIENTDAPGQTVIGVPSTHTKEYRALYEEGIGNWATAIDAILEGKDNSSFRTHEHMKGMVWDRLVSGERDSLTHPDTPRDVHIGALLWAGEAERAQAEFNDWWFNRDGRFADDKMLRYVLGDVDYLDQLLENAEPPAEGAALFQSGTQDSELAAVGPMLPGTLQSQGAAPVHDSQVHGEGYDNYVRPVLAELRKAMSGPQPAGASGRLDADGQALLAGWMNDAKHAQTQATLGALRMGESFRDMALLNYNRRYMFDGALSMIMPYQFFATRTMTNWALRVADKPAILSWFARLAGLQREKERRDEQLPSRLRGKVFMPMPFLPDWMGDGIYLDPLGKLFPFRDQMRPYEQLVMEGRANENRAYDLLKQWAQTGEVNPDQAQAAMKAKSGALWERAMTQAQASEGMDWTDMASLFVSPALYLTVPYKWATGQMEETGPYPLSRTLQALSAATGIKGLQNLDFEAQWRKNAGMSPYGKWGDYYIDRQLVNLVADGVIDAKTAQTAMIERSGPAYEQAVARVQQETMMRTPGALPIYTAGQALQGKAGIGDVAASLLLGWIPSNILPAGEMQMRGLSDEYSKAWEDYRAGDKKAINNFMKAHPEYQARAALYAEPEERMRNYLVSEVWDRFTALGALDKRGLDDQLGAEFASFLDGEYDAISNETLASWAQALGGTSPGVDVEPAEVKLAAPEMSQLYDAYRAEKDQLFPGLTDLWAGYHALEKGSAARKQYWKEHPELKAYMDWQEQYLKDYPELTPVVKQSETADTSKVYDDIKSYPGLLAQLQGAQYGERMSKGSMDLLKLIWEKNGKPTGHFNSWLASMGVPGY